MKKIFKFVKQNIIGFIIGGIVFGSLGVYAAVVITSKEITYEDNTSIGATNVQDAIDKLNTKATTNMASIPIDFQISAAADAGRILYWDRVSFTDSYQ